jgi:4-amino-4-deoxy-L-arabinose transferase-like glycosyltransferase
VPAADRTLRAARHRLELDGSEPRSEIVDLTAWTGLVAAGLLLTAVAVAVHARVGSAGAPFTGTYHLKIDIGSVLAPAVAVTVLAAVRAGLVDRLRWPVLLIAAYVAAVWWAIALALVDGGNGLASPMTSPAEYLHDVGAVGSDPIGFVRGFVDHSTGYSVATRTHPPGPVLLLWLLHRVGIDQPQTLGLLLTLLGCAYLPLLAVAVRSLCHETAARRLLPALVLAPFAVWLCVSMDAVTLLLAAGFVCCGVLASERERSWRWTVGCGLLLGIAALFNYAVAWLAVTVIATYFVRRRPMLNVYTGVAALIPLALFRIWGFTWPKGLTAAQADFSLRVGPHRSWALWAALDLLVLLIACGPAVLRAARRVRLTPGWPFLAGAGLAVLFAVASGLSRGEVERSWLPFFPWLLVAAVAPARRPVEGEPDAGPTPYLLICVGAVGAIVVEAVLRTPW